MSYVRIPSTVSKIQAENRLQREFLQKCEQQFLKYQQWCPQLIGPLDELRRVMYALTRNIDIQDALIQQRIRIQASLIHPELGNATAYYPSNAETLQESQIIYGSHRSTKTRLPCAWNMHKLKDKLLCTLLRMQDSPTNLPPPAVNFCATRPP